MSKYFQEVDLELPEAPERDGPKTIKQISWLKLIPVLEEIDKEMLKIKNGTSTLTSYAIDNQKFGSPVGNALKILTADPSIKSAKGFIELAKQDLGAKAADHFKKLLSKTIEEVPTNG